MKHMQTNLPTEIRLREADTKEENEWEVYLINIKFKPETVATRKVKLITQVLATNN